MSVLLKTLFCISLSVHLELDVVWGCKTRSSDVREALVILTTLNLDPKRFGIKRLLVFNSAVQCFVLSHGTL